MFKPCVHLSSSSTFRTKYGKQTKDPKYLFRKPAQVKMNIVLLYAVSLKKKPAVPLVKTFNNALLLFQHIIHNVIIKANFKNHFFLNIAVSWKRKPHTTPSNDLVANTCTCMHCYTESMQQRVDILDCRCKAAACKPWAVYLPLSPSG